MELTEAKIFKAFDLTPPEPSETTPEPETIPEEEQTEPAGMEAAPEEPEPEADEADESAKMDEEPDEDGAEQKPTPQTEEQRRKNAERRRRYETRKAVDDAVREALEQKEREHAAEREAFFRQAGLTDPFTKKPITNMEEFHAWKRAQDDARLQQELKSGKLTRETLDQLVSEAVRAEPAVQAALERQERERDDGARERDARFQQDVEAQLAEIRKTEPGVQSVGDLLNQPWSSEFYAAVKRGNSFLDAYYLATRDRGLRQAAVSARQQALNSVNGKEHLRRTSVGGKAGATVTTEEEKMYRLFNPDATPEQIQAYQNKVKKG